MSRIEIIGAGVVGQATGKGFAHFGHELTFRDINLDVLDLLKRQGYDTVHPGQVSRFKSDITMLCVSTPTVNGAIDLDPLRAACQTVAMTLRQDDEYRVVVVRSTVPPCTTEEVVIPLLERYAGKMAGRDFGICHNPEFLREASALEDFINPWVVVIGAYDQRSSQPLYDLYQPIARRTGIDILETDLRTSEMLKYVNNIYNATKISFTNEIWSACRALGIDGDEVMSIVSRSAEGSWNPEYGIKGGYSYGGNCLPKDTLAFLAFGRERGLDLRMLEQVVQVNQRIGVERSALVA
jgi:UDPglucose 6-dehydrogenase